MFTNDIARSTRLCPEPRSPPPDLECILRSSTLHEVLACSKVPTKGKNEATSTIAWEATMDAGKSDEASCDCQGVEEQKLEPGTTLEDEDDSIATALQMVIADEVRSQVANVLTKVVDMAEVAAEQLIGADTLTAQGESALWCR